MLWVLNLSDGSHSLLDIAERSQLKYELIYRAAKSLLENDLLAERSEHRSHNIEQEIAT